MDTKEGVDPALPDRQSIKQEVTYDLVPYTGDEVYDNYDVKQEPPDDMDVMEESEEITIKQEYFSAEEHPMVDEYETANDELDYTEENDYHRPKASAFAISATMPCLAVMKPRLKEKRTASWKNTSERDKNNLTDNNGEPLDSGRHLPKGHSTIIYRIL